MAKNQSITFDVAFDHLENFKRATTVSPDGTEWRDLQCPKCGCDKINAEKLDLGEQASCFECGYEFMITENCFVLTRTYSGGWDEMKRGLGLDKKSLSKIRLSE